MEEKTHVERQFRRVVTKPRVFIISDISNEPDDAESLVRYLLYSNELATQGLVACTSTWMKRAVHPEDMHRIIHAYGTVVDNLNHHVHPSNQYSPASTFHDVVKTGPTLYGKEALEPDVPLSEGASFLLDRLDESDEPLWVLCWGGTNVLAQALQHAEQRLSPQYHARQRSKLRIYAISDQDDTGAWLRQRFPDIFYIVSIHGWNEYGRATWTGISGDDFYKFDQGGPDSTNITKAWIRKNIQVGPLGEAYPDPIYIPEGDTPTFLYLIQNGLGSPEHPSWGSWGGRYTSADPSNRGLYSDAFDRILGHDGKLHISNQATIWRWRDAYQNDFAARIQWTLTPDVAKCNHPPVAIVNESTPGPEPLFLDAEADSEVILDASRSYDPDGDELTFTWTHYKEPTATQWLVDQEVADVDVVDLDKDIPGSKVRLRMPPAEKCAVDLFSGKALEKGQQLHFVLSVKDSGTPSLTTYKRVVVQITNSKLEGGRAMAVESIAEAQALR